MRTLQAFASVILLLFSTGCKENAKTITEGPDRIYIQNPYPAFAGKVHEVTLFVETDKITQTTTEEYANFRQPYYISNEDYTTFVNPGDIVIWKGVSVTDTLDIVNIERIQHHSGRRYLGKNVIQGNKGEPEIVVAMIQKNNNPDNSPRKDEKYEIMFSVYNDGDKRNGTFKIDPKLEVPPKQY